MRFLLATIFVTILAIPSMAQKGFEGEILYKMVYEEVPEEMEMMKGMLPTEMAMMIKGQSSRIEQSMMMGMKQITLVDMKAEKIHILMDMMGKKMKMSMNMDDADKGKGDQDIDIKYVDGDGKKVAGYNCKRAEIKSEDNKAPIVVYYTDEIDGGLSREFKGLKGFPLEYQVAQQGMVMQVTADKVEKKQLAKSLFEVSSDYEEMDPAMIEKMMGGQ